MFARSTSSCPVNEIFFAGTWEIFGFATCYLVVITR
jgi:hypothetical protein